MQDFHELCLSLLRRLVQTVLFVAESRIKARKVQRPKTKLVVWRRDVEAAVASLALTGNSNEFWAKCPRRLRLNVFAEEHGTVPEDETDFMDYDDVESELRPGGNSGGPETTDEVGGDAETDETAESSESDIMDEEVEMAEHHILSVSDKRKGRQHAETQHRQEGEAEAADQQVSFRQRDGSLGSYGTANSR